MSAYFIAVVVTLTGWVCRWTAHARRVAPPRRFTAAQRGWWLPPMPAAREFASAGARRLEVLGRLLMLAGVLGLLAVTTIRGLAAG